MGVSDTERLAVVETKLDALIKSNADVSAKMDVLIANYVPRSEYDKGLTEVRVQYEKDMAELRLSIEKARTKSALQVWLTGTLAALFGVIMTVLIQNYFSH